MAQSRKKTTKTKSRQNAQSAKKNTQQNIKPVEKYELTEKQKKIRNEIKLLITLTMTLLIELSCFGFLSPLGDYISYFLFGSIGLIAYVAPVVLFLGIAFLVSNKNNRNAVIKFCAGVSFSVLLASMIQLIFVGYNESYNAVHYFEQCGADKNGGGFLGGLIVNVLCGNIGLVGTYIILLLLLIVSLVLLTERSFIGGVKKGSKKVYDSAKEDVVRIKENAENYSKEKAYQKNKRMNRKVRGVALTKLDDPDYQDEDMHEITSKVPENTYVYRGHVEPEEVEENVANKRVIERSVVEPKYDDISYEEEHTDEEGMFKPKEQIIVSEDAKKVMNRKPFSTNQNLTVNTPKQATQAKASVNTSNRNNEYILPSTNLLNKGTSSTGTNQSELRKTAANLENILKNFGVSAGVTDFSKGPSVTRYEIQPETGTRLSKITSLADDIKLNLAATDIRIEPIPGKSTVGIEVPNEKRESVFIRDLIESKELMNNASKLSFAAGKDIAGKVIIGDIAKMPHLLVAGTTGSGKSVFTNSIIMSILFRATPEEVRLLIVDPKVVEFGVYNGIPHLLQPVVTDARLASNMLKWAVAQMQDRYKRFADLNVRDLKGYNEKVSTMKFSDDEEKLEKLPQIVIVIDELADLMMVAAKEVEESICRLAQLARAAGIHLIIATQRPSVDVVTGLIKANIPSRCALMVSSGVDSRTIIDQNGAEKLLGNGDMLFYPSGYVKPVRLQGAFVSDAEVQKVVDFWKGQVSDVKYDETISNYVASQPAVGNSAESSDGNDEYFDEAVKFVVEKQKASTSMLQRVFKIGFNRASRIMEQLEEAGIVGQEEGTKPRKVLVSPEELED